jgi:hypothetical protein
MNGIASQQLKVKLSKYHALPLIYQIIRHREISACRIVMVCLLQFRNANLELKYKKN